MKLRLLTAAVFVLMLSVGCKLTDKEGQPFTLEGAEKDISAANDRFEEFILKKDSVGLAGLYTSDAKWMEPNAPAFEGRAMIQKRFGEMLRAGDTKISLVTASVYGSEEMLAEEGGYTVMNKAGYLLDKGKYIVLWKMEDGKWKIFRDLFNSDLTVPPAKP